MEIALLTSSRADYGFFRPLLETAKKNKSIHFNIVVFGTHLSEKHGYTIDQIKKDGYKIYTKIETLLTGDSPEKISETIGVVHIKFSKFWAKNRFDFILCLGDRYEIYAAVSASVPFNIPVIHLSGGEETSGAIDNYYRNALTLMSTYHFTNTQANAKRVTQLLGHSKHVYHSGSLAIENITNTKTYSFSEFRDLFNFDIKDPFILFTFHPETVDYKKNIEYALIVKNVLKKMKTRVLVTMPNADTMGDLIRKELKEAAKNNPKIKLVESLGSKGYYTALKNCLFVMGNSSSGIVEAASFKKYALNLGNRQGGRERNNNVIDVPISESSILRAIAKINSLPKLTNFNVYGDGKTSKKIIKVLYKISNHG